MLAPVFCLPPHRVVFVQLLTITIDGVHRVKLYVGFHGLPSGVGGGGGGPLLGDPPNQGGRFGGDPHQPSKLSVSHQA